MQLSRDARLLPNDCLTSQSIHVGRGFLRMLRVYPYTACMIAIKLRDLL